jgi:hypothetical protein
MERTVMTTATTERKQRIGNPSEPEGVSNPEVGEDGYPVRYWKVGGEMVPFSLRPFEPHERPLYWNPYGGGKDGRGQTMRWRHYEPDERGLYPLVARHEWNYPYPGSFSPRNAWEQHMTEEYMRRNLKGARDPKTLMGWNHPEHTAAVPKFYRCAQCKWGSGNLRAMKQHLLTVSHEGMMVD